VKYTKKVDKAAEPSEVRLVADSGSWGVRFPAVTEYLTSVRWDDGELRTPATILLVVNDGRWNVCLNDREHSRSTWATGDTPDEALTALEGALQSGRESWRTSNGFKQRKAR
jgi:predicted RNase H-like HicB family nuclease